MLSAFDMNARNVCNGKDSDHPFSSVKINETRDLNTIKEGE